MTPFADRVQALASLGFSDVQTRFLATVALHGGYCLHRQYRALSGLAHGAGVRSFFDRLVTRELAWKLAFRPDRGWVYGLARSLVRAAGQDDGRHRRHVSPAFIARQLMLLDYILSPQELEWAVTEADKVALFTEHFGVPPTELPHRLYGGLPVRRNQPPIARAFVHKWPIGCRRDDPTVTFVALATDATGQAFSQFLQDHTRLLSQLTDWRIVLVAPRGAAGVPACETAFRQLGLPRQRPLWPGDAELLWACRFHANGMCKDPSGASLDENLARFSAVTKRLGIPRYQRAYRRWTMLGDAAIDPAGSDAIRTAITSGRGAFVVYRLPVSFDRFGTRPGVS